MWVHHKVLAAAMSARDENNNRCDVALSLLDMLENKNQVMKGWRGLQEVHKMSHSQDSRTLANI